MFKNMKISGKILCVVLCITLGTLAILSGLSYTHILNITSYFQNVNADLGLASSERSKQALLSQAEEYLLKLNAAQAESTDKTLQQISGAITELAGYMGALYRNADNFKGREPPTPDRTQYGVASSKYMLAPGVEATEALHKELLLVSNAEYAFAPLLANNSLLDNVYLGTQSGISYRFSRSNAYDPNYDPRVRGWYKAAVKRPNEPVWLNTYQDSYGTICITCAQTFPDAGGALAGVVAMDITLAKVFEEITNVHIGETGYAFILDADMDYIAHPRYTEEGFSLSPMLTATGEHLRALESIRDNASGLVETTLDGVESYVTYATLEATGWKICISIDIDEIVAPADAAMREIDQATDEAQSSIRKTLSSNAPNYIVTFASMCVLVVILAFVVSGSITRPIKRLAKTARRIGEGELDVKAEVRGRDEVGELAASFNAMTDDLRVYIDRLTSITADKERIATELNVAAGIQKSMLPRDFPAFPDRDEFDLYAFMQPAREVGGDFYDFFMVDRRHLAVVIADVSGKGVPAALFMVIGKTLIKDHTQPGVDLGEVFTEVNRLLCEANSEGLFITAFEGVLDLVTGEFRFVNAGHEAPFLCKAGGLFEAKSVKPGFVLAGMESMRYKAGQFTLAVGDKVFVYTDGVTEATNARNELYGIERLTHVLCENTAQSPADILPAVKADIDAFVGSAEPFDDMTMLCLEYTRQMKDAGSAE